MLRTAVGFNPGQSLLSGLRGTQGYGKAMAAASKMNLDADKANKAHMLKQEESDSQQRQQKARQNAQHQQNAIQNQAKASQLAGEKGLMNIQNSHGYAQLRKRKRINQQQTVLNHLASDES